MTPTLFRGFFDTVTLLCRVILPTLYSFAAVLTLIPPSLTAATAFFIFSSKSESCGLVPFYVRGILFNLDFTADHLSLKTEKESKKTNKKKKEKCYF